MKESGVKIHKNYLSQYYSQKLFESILQFNLVTNKKPVDLFILGMSSIVRWSHRKQHDIASCGLLEGQSDWNAATLTCQIRFHTKNCGT